MGGRLARFASLATPHPHEWTLTAQLPIAQAVIVQPWVLNSIEKGGVSEPACRQAERFFPWYDVDETLFDALHARFAARATRTRLNKRQKSVLRLVAEGLPNREIAEQLGVSERTAAGDVSKLLEKLEVNTRAEAVAVAIRQGLLDD
jgi:DNA-binding CsgD family transcriptional regulator